MWSQNQQSVYIKLQTSIKANRLQWLSHVERQEGSHLTKLTYIQEMERVNERSLSNKRCEAYMIQKFRTKVSSKCSKVKQKKSSWKLIQLTTSETISPLQAIIHVTETLWLCSKRFDDTLDGHKCLRGLAKWSTEAGDNGKLCTLPSCPKPQQWFVVVYLHGKNP